MYRNELRLYHLSKGLKGKHLKIAIRKDVRLARKNVASPWANCHASAADLRKPLSRHEYLGTAFVWNHTPEGFDYWYDRATPY